jgi:hypothetical protein
MKLSKYSLALDNIGIFASSLCAIHCALVPLLITLLPLSGLSFLASEWLEVSMIAIAFFIGLVSLGFSLIKTHKTPLPFTLLLVGFSLILAGHFFFETLEYLIIPLGGIVIAISHYVNWKLTISYKNHPH